MSGGVSHTVLLGMPTVIVHSAFRWLVIADDLACRGSCGIGSNPRTARCRSRLLVLVALLTSIM